MSFLRWLRGSAPALFFDLAGTAGVALISYGAWLIYEPAGYITGGIMLVAGALLGARRIA